MKPINELTPDEINTEIAEWMGIDPMCGKNFYGCLNAIAAAEKKLRQNQFQYVAYPSVLFETITQRKWSGDMGYFAFNFITATAPERAYAIITIIRSEKGTK